MSQVIALVATYPRVKALLTTSIPSIARQIRLPDALVIVSDKQRLPPEVLKRIQSLIPETHVIFLENRKTSGVAGTWNTGLRFIGETFPNAYVAILDDDDQWDNNHLSLCMSMTVCSAKPDVVISGLRICSKGKEIPRPPLQNISTDDFLIGNPGWQGSNTFASVAKINLAGGFRESLDSCHDRDLALRMLDLPELRISFTGRTTATWNLNTYPNTLSRAGSKKKAALRKFLELHGHRMSFDVRHRFLARCCQLFSLSEYELQ